jgi:hypothetical protein
VKALVVIIALALVVGCDKKDAASSTAGSASAASSAPVASASVAPSASAPLTTVAMGPKKIPSQADEAVAASKDITKANYKSELDKIEKGFAAKK